MDEILVLTIGGNFIQNGVEIVDSLGAGNVYFLETERAANRQLGLTVTGMVNLHQAIMSYYQRIPSQNNQDVYVNHYNRKIVEDLRSVIIPSAKNPIFLLISLNDLLKVAVLFFKFDFKHIIRNSLGRKIVQKRSMTTFPEYMATESSGAAILTLEFNIPTDFDNANFRRAEDDNYTSNIEEFINSPQFNLALHIRPKIYNKCSKEHCKKCYKKFLEKKKCQKYTSTSALQNMVSYIYGISVKIQRQEIPFDEGKTLIDEKLKLFDSYWDEGASMYIIDFVDDNIVFFLCKRYHLKEKDCIVGFNLTGTDDFITNQEDPKYKQVLMNVSSVPIDEDMSDSVYSSNTGVFIYKSSLD